MLNLHLAAASHAIMQGHKSAPRCLNNRGHDTEGCASMLHELTSFQLGSIAKSVVR